LRENALAAGKGLVVGQPGRSLAEQHRHDHADADAERERQQNPGNREVGAEGDAGIGERQDIGGRGEEQEGNRRAEAGAFLVDAGKQGLHGA
jgi:hypothetical protein